MLRESSYRALSNLPTCHGSRVEWLPAISSSTRLTALRSMKSKYKQQNKRISDIMLGEMPRYAVKDSLANNKNAGSKIKRSQRVGVLA